MTLPGVKLTKLARCDDSRGSVMEIYREVAAVERSVQWNVYWSAEGVLRGMHSHIRHTDYLILLEGEAFIGLKDVRPDSPSNGCTAHFEISSTDPCRLTIPPGVTHGTYFPAASILLQGLSGYWDPDNELGCRWDDPELGIEWPCVAPRISRRDDALPAFGVLAEAMREALAKPVERPAV
jgi:dTDP-4-dehydrorhamnose 3,5-epimerase